MNYNIYLFTFFIISGISKSQTNCACNYITDYYQNVYKGQYHYLKENFDSAYIYLKKAEEKCPLLNLTSIREPEILAQSSTKLGKFDEAIFYIERLLKDGNKFENIEKDSIYQPLKNSKEWEKLKLESKFIYENWKVNVNLDLRNELNDMKVADQAVRKNKPIDFEEMKRVDSLNILRLKEIVEEFGYPTSKLLGNHSIDNKHVDIMIFFFHITEAEDVEYFKKFLFNSVKCGKVDYPFVYANLIDSNDRSSGVFTYGIYDNVEIDRILEPENLDKRRIEAGLPPRSLHKEIQVLIDQKYLQ